MSDYESSVLEQTAQISKQKISNVCIPGTLRTDYVVVALVDQMRHRHAKPLPPTKVADADSLIGGKYI